MRRYNARDLRKRNVYLDIESIAGWLRLEGVPARLTRVKDSYALEIVAGDQPKAPLVPLTPYDSNFVSISTQDLASAIEMSRATLDDVQISLSGKQVSCLDAIQSYAAAMISYGTVGSLYAVINRISLAIGRKVTIASQTNSNGPKGTPIVTVSLALGATPLCSIVCTGSGYSLSCSEQRILEGILKTATPETAKLIVSRCYRL